MSVLNKVILIVIGVTTFASVLAIPSLAPPPVGPFQVAKPNVYSPVPTMNQHNIKMMPAPSQNIKVPVAPVLKKMNLQVPYPPKEVPNQPLQPEPQVKKMNAPVNRLVKPQKPVQQVPKQFVSPLVAPVLPGYITNPAPVHNYRQVPQLPLQDSNAVAPASGLGQNYPDTFRKNTLQPKLQSNKQQGKQ